MPRQYTTDTVGELITSFDDPRSRSILEFCGIENVSLTYYYALKKKGLAPVELRPPGTKLVRITAQAHAEWRERMHALGQAEDAALLEARRKKQTSEAGKRAALLAAERAAS
jgi:hypothetical protein